MLNLNQVERQKKHGSAECCINQQGQQIRSSECSNAEEREWQHWLGSSRFDKHKNDEKRERSDQDNNNGSMGEAESRRFE